MKKLWVLLGMGAALLVGRGDAQTLLVVNQGDSTMSLIDPAAGMQVGAVTEGIAGVHAHEAAVSADGWTAYLPIYGSTGVGKPGSMGTRCNLSI